MQVRGTHGKERLLSAVFVNGLPYDVRTEKGTYDFDYCVHCGGLHHHYAGNSHFTEVSIRYTGPLQYWMADGYFEWMYENGNRVKLHIEDPFITATDARDCRWWQWEKDMRTGVFGAEHAPCVEDSNATC